MSLSQVVKPHQPVASEAAGQGGEGGLDAARSGTAVQNRGRRSPSPGGPPSNSGKAGGKPESPGVRRRRASPVPVSFLTIYQ